MTEREAAASLYGAKVLFDEVVKTLRRLIHDRGQEPAGDVLEEIVDGFEDSIDDFMKGLLTRAMAVEMELR